jgi:hypothetical protein
MMATSDMGSQHASDMPEVVVPSTPPPPSCHNSNSSEMTPPPSTQAPKTNNSTIQPNSAQRALFLQSPPSTVGSGTASAVPTPEQIAKAEPEEVREMAKNLVVAVTDAHTLAAHFKLQHSLLTMESQESAQRAEIEHQMTRREMEVLQAAESHRTALTTTTAASQPAMQPQISLLSEYKGLEEEKAELEQMLHKAKKIIEQEIDKADLLREENLMLKARIRENRVHFTRMRQSPAFSTCSFPCNGLAAPQRKSAHRFIEPSRSHASRPNQDPFAALLAADQVLSAKSPSVPSTPTKTLSSDIGQSHTPGSFSLSSVQAEPAHFPPTAAGENIHQSKGSSGQKPAHSAASVQVAGMSGERDRHSRDSTISVSDEEALTDEDVPQSQASSLATNMLRRNPGSQKSSAFPGKAEKSSKALQTKLFGQTKKAGMERKRHANFDETNVAKKTKLTEGVGLGIGGWGTSKDH